MNLSSIPKIASCEAVPVKGLGILVLWVISILLASCGSPDRDGPMADRIRNTGDVSSAIRKGLKVHAQSITIRLDYGSDIFDELSEVADDYMEKALEETAKPDEGDYLRYQMGGYTYNCSSTIEGERRHYAVKIIPQYYCSLEEEIAAGAKAEEVLRGFDFPEGTTDEERIRSVYTWLCGNVRYDRPHRKNPYYHKCSTAYAAMVQRSATCQGYCTALYRLLKSLGINCRIVTGTVTGDDETVDRKDELHAWVIAELDGLWYGLDPTWDAGEEEFAYFLVGAEHFADHIPGDAFLTEDFTEKYPMADEDCMVRENSELRKQSPPPGRRGVSGG